MSIKDFLTTLHRSHQDDTTKTEPDLLQEAMKQEDPNLAQTAKDIAQELTEALKTGPVKVTTDDGQDEQVHVPPYWTGALSGLDFTAQMGPEGMVMTFAIPTKTTPITLVISVKDEFSLFETAQSIDFSMAVAADPNQIPMPVIGANAIRISWLIGFLRMATEQVRINMDSPQDPRFAMMLSAQDQKEGRNKAEKMLSVIEQTCSRLENTLQPFNKDGLMTKMSVNPMTATIH